jgi:3-keto-5-aminohexanoate cleavage enzyme
VELFRPLCVFEEDQSWFKQSATDDYLEVNALVREKCPDIIINNTTSGIPGITIEQRLACVEHAKPEMASLDIHAFILRIIIKGREPGQPGMPFDVCIPWTYGESEKYATKMKEKGVKPELEIYDPSEFWFVDSLIKGGFVAPPYWIQFVMGFQTSMYATPANVLNLVQHLPPNSLFSMIGTGVNQMPMVTVGIILGGHVSVGMEDNVYIEAGKLAKSNAEQVERGVRLAKEMDRPIATPKETRQMLAISEQPTQY